MAKGGLDDFQRVNGSRAQGAQEHFLIGDQSVLAVQEQHPEPLLQSASQQSRQALTDGVW